MPEECPAAFVLRGRLNINSSQVKKSTLSIAVHHSGAGHLQIELINGNAVVSRITEKGTVMLAEAKLPVLNGPFNMRLFRNQWQVELTIGGRRIIRANEGSLMGGKVGFFASGAGLELSSISLQPAAPIYFTDDFTRGEGETGEWDIWSGTFDVREIHGASKKAATGVSYSANAFRWQSNPEDTNFAAAGRWHWKNYQFAVSVRPSANGITGMCVLVQDKDNYVAFECDSGPSGKCRLMEMREGKLSKLAEADARLESGQWYRLDVSTVGNQISARIDGTPVCTIGYDGWQCGRVGIMAENSGAEFDDVQVLSTDGMHAEADTMPSAESKTMFPFGNASLITLGYEGWRNTEFSLTGRKAKSAAIVYGLEKHSFGVMQISSKDVEIFRVKDGEGAQSLGKASIGKFESITLRPDGHTVYASVDGKPLLAVYDPGETGGVMGLAWERGKTVPFEKVDASQAFSLYPPSRITDQFLRETTMLDWSTPSSFWQPLESGEHLYEGGIFGDLDIELTNTAHITASDDWALILSDPNQKSTAKLKVSSNTVSLSVDSKEAGSAGLPPDFQKSGLNLTLKARARSIELVLGGKTLLHANAPDGNRWNRLLFHPVATKLSPSYFSVRSPKMTDIIFSGAPVQWWAERGQWDIHPRWPCDDRWSFLGGINSESPVLWSKRRYESDMIVDAWIALYMDNAGEASVGYKNISDLNITICADGRNLDSGYSFQFGAKGNTVSQIRKGSDVVSETPLVRMIAPRRMHIGWQRHWYHLRAVKAGKKISFFVDGIPTLEYEDPNPLPGGHVALWTWRGGLMVARARIAAESISLPQRPTYGLSLAGSNESSWKVANKPVQLLCDFENGSGGWSTNDDHETEAGQTQEGKRKYLQVRNRIAGGSLGIAAGIKAFDAVQFPKLSFEFRADESVKVNLFAVVNGTRVSIPMTAGEDASDSLSLRSTNVKADGKWHSVDYDLLAALKEKLPAAGQYSVQNLQIAAPFIEYLRSGIGGNRFGDSYGLDNFALIAADSVAASVANSISVE
ncbi:MAG: hypothetical protein O3B01_07895 [Planctomycetota bacterium]|nr:hypothetical protein [Planctomycetota bacterium]